MYSIGADDRGMRRVILAFSDSRKRSRHALHSIKGWCHSLKVSKLPTTHRAIPGIQTKISPANSALLSTSGAGQPATAPGYSLAASQRVCHALARSFGARFTSAISACSTNY
eukprot:5644674-Pleurochrysis_carterae.AAC.1